MNEEESNYVVNWNDNGKSITEICTESFQEAIDTWTGLRVQKKCLMWIEVNAFGQIRTLKNESEIKEWAEWLMKKGYNRIEKRIMTEMMEQKEEKKARGLDDFEDIQGTRELFSQEEVSKLSRLSIPKTAPEETDFHGDFGGMSLEMQDAIINPKHYKMIPPEAYEKHPNGLEYMDLMEYILEHHKGVQGHLLGQIFKYACRLGRKDNIEQDATKIEWYANRLVKVIQNAKVGTEVYKTNG